MNCEICSLDSTVDTVMWTCVGCARSFHAACVGVTVQRSYIRKKEKKADPQSYILPCCSSCQALVALSFDLKQLTEQQAQLTEIVNKNTEVSHRSAQQNNIGILHEAVDRIEVLLIDLKKELTRNNGSAGNVVPIKNHITALFDIAMQDTKKNLSTSLDTMTSSISGDLRCLNDEIKQLYSLTMDMASNGTAHQNSLLELDILDELKSLSANIVTSRCDQSAVPITSSLNSCSSQEIESNRTEALGEWRFLGNKKVWRGDWTEYDAREARRLRQKKLADKARKRRRARQNAVNNNNNFYSHRRDNNNFRNMYRNGYHDRNTNRSNMSNNRDNNSYNYNNFNNNHRNPNFANRQNSAYQLPPDRELLAAAKDQFSRPPTNYQPSIQFRRGEILNPYPPSGHSSQSFTTHPPSEACSCRHSCFPRN